MEGGAGSAAAWNEGEKIADVQPRGTDMRSAAAGNGREKILEVQQQETDVRRY